MEAQREPDKTHRRGPSYVDAHGVRLVRLTPRQAAARAVWDRKGRERATEPTPATP